jgi:HK97 family phage portal protein
MGLIDRLFGKPKATGTGGGDTRFETITAYQPTFTSWGGQIYESELVRAAVDAKARHVCKLQYTMEGTARQKLYTATKTEPNPWYTWPQFLERCSNIYDIQNNLFIVPVLDKLGEITGFFPVLPSSCEVVSRGGKPYLKYQFMNGQMRAMELDRCAVVTKHQLNDDFFGEKNTALNSTMQLVHMVEQGIIEGVRNAATYRFMAQLTGKAFDEDLRRERERFDKNNFQSGGGGLLLFGNQFTNVKELSQKSYEVNAEQQKLIRENIENYFGVPESVIKNEAAGDVLDAFFNGAIEPFAIKLSDALSRMVFTERERNGGNRILFTANRLQYMSAGTKIQMAQQLGDRGVLTIDEIRELFNYAPLPDGAGGYTPIRGEYKDVRDPDDNGGNNDE